MERVLNCFGASDVLPSLTKTLAAPPLQFCQQTPFLPKLFQLTAHRLLSPFFQGPANANILICRVPTSRSPPPRKDKLQDFFLSSATAAALATGPSSVLSRSTYLRTLCQHGWTEPGRYVG